jgi:hypothetical protein
MAQLTSSPKSLYADQDPWGIAARLSQRSHRQAESHAAFANGPALEDEAWLPLEAGALAAVQNLGSCSEPFRLQGAL